MLLHTVTVTAQWNFKVISPHDGMMAKCFQHDNFCHMLISICVYGYVCVCGGILKQKCISLVMDLHLLSQRCECPMF